MFSLIFKFIERVRINDWRVGASLVAQMVKNLLQCGRPEFSPWVGEIPWRRERLPIPVFGPAGFHGQRSLAGYSSWGRKELDTTEWLSLFMLVIIACMSEYSLQYSPLPIYLQRRSCLKYNSFALLPLPFQIGKTWIHSFLVLATICRALSSRFTITSNSHNSFLKCGFLYIYIYIFFSVSTTISNVEDSTVWGLHLSNPIQWQVTGWFAFLFPSSHCPSYLPEGTQYIFPMK